MRRRSLLAFLLFLALLALPSEASDGDGVADAQRVQSYVIAHFIDIPDEYEFFGLTKTELQAKLIGLQSNDWVFSLIESPDAILITERTCCGRLTRNYLIKFAGDKVTAIRYNDRYGEEHWLESRHDALVRALIRHGDNIEAQLQNLWERPSKTDFTKAYRRSGFAQHKWNHSDEEFALMKLSHEYRSRARVKALLGFEKLAEMDSSEAEKIEIRLSKLLKQQNWWQNEQAGGVGAPRPRRV